MSGVNKAILIGHCGADPDIRRTSDGRPVASFNIATSETWRDKDSGERKERTQWHRIVVFNEGLCKVIEQYVKKGSKLYIEGQIETRSWTDQANIKKYVTEIVLRAFSGSIQLLDKSNGGVPPNDGSGEDSSRPGSQSRAGSAAPPDDMNDDIPF